MKYKIKYIPVIIAATLAALAGCTKDNNDGQSGSGTGGKKIRIYVPAMKAPQDKTKAVQADDQNAGISVYYEALPSAMTRAELGVGELTPLQESAINNLGIGTSLDDDQGWYYSVNYIPGESLNTSQHTENYVEFDDSEKGLFIIAGERIPFPNIPGFALLDPSIRYTDYTLGLDYPVVYYNDAASVTEGGLAMIPDSWSTIQGNQNTLYARRIPAKIDISVTINPDIENRVELTSIQLKNAPKLFSIVGGFWSMPDDETMNGQWYEDRTPIPQEGGVQERFEADLTGDGKGGSAYYNPADYYMDYTPIENSLIEPDNFVAGQRYVWYMAPNFDDWNYIASEATSKKELTVENSSNLYIKPTHILITGQYQTTDGDDNSWEEFKLTIIPFHYNSGYYCHIYPNTWYKLVVNLTDLTPGNGDERLEYGGVIIIEPDEPE